MGVTVLAVALTSLSASLAYPSPASASVAKTGAAARHCIEDVDAGRVRCFGSSRGADAAIPADRVRLGKFFDGRDYQGASFSLYGAKTCRHDNGDDYSPYTLSNEWTNRIRSLIPEGNCYLTLRSAPDGQGGSSPAYKTGAASLGAWDRSSKSVTIG
ncbi:hypothetical protein ACQEVG_18240 [Streptomyces sp. CA-135486]|uniref:hypothetical protein n=1 Tax=Streptomyces sp. CA-135486 TaxID=3240049 RepID=UPI003D8FE8E8